MADSALEEYAYTMLYEQTQTASASLVKKIEPILNASSIEGE